MRKLNRKQQRYLDALFGMGVKNVDDMNAREFMMLVGMGDHETIYQNADRYLWDREMESRND